MTLFHAYIVLGVALFAAGVGLVGDFALVRSAVRAFARSFFAALVTFGGGAVWFLWGIAQLGESDLAGFSREFMLGLFGVSALLAFRFLKDFLAVRGLGVVFLLGARALLEAGYMQLPYSFVLACSCYVLVVLGVWWGVAPYVFRDWVEWAQGSRARWRCVGVGIGAVGIANLVSAFWVPGGGV